MGRSTAVADEHSKDPYRTWLGRAGVFVVLASILGLVGGMLLIESLKDEFNRTLVVSGAAIESVGETVETARDVAEGTTSAVRSASAAASSAATASRDAASALGDVAEFLDSGLPENIDAVRRALPGAIDAADAVDTTLGALSLLGVAYSPDEPFGDSLRRVESALEGLPSDLSNQSDSVSQLVPSAEELADDVQSLSADLSRLSSDLGDVDELAASYSATVGDAEVAVRETESSLARTTWLLRLVVVLASAGAFVVGLALIGVQRRFESIEEPVATHAAA